MRVFAISLHQLLSRLLDFAFGLGYFSVCLVVCLQSVLSDGKVNGFSESTMVSGKEGKEGRALTGCGQGPERRFMDE